MAPPFQEDIRTTLSGHDAWHQLQFLCKTVVEMLLDGGETDTGKEHLHKSFFFNIMKLIQGLKHSILFFKKLTLLGINMVFFMPPPQYFYLSFWMC